MRAGLLAPALAVASVSTAPARGQCPAPLPTQGLPQQAQPAAHPWPEWGERTAALSARLALAPVAATELVLIGDSLVASWAPDIFEQFYGARRPLNLGIPGDTTQTLLWRLGQGNWPAALRPRAVVLLVGTNNLDAGWPPDMTARAVLRVVAELRAKAPGTRVVLVGLLPRGAEPDDPRRAAIGQVNDLLRPCHDGRSLFWAEPGSVLLDGRQRLTPLISFDATHLTPYGYAILSAALEPVVRAALAAR